MPTARLTLNDHPVHVFFTYDEDDGLNIVTVEALLPPTGRNPAISEAKLFVDVSPLLGTKDFDELEHQIWKNYDRIVAEANEEAV